MVTPLEWGLFALITLLTGLLSAYIVYRVIKPGLKKAIAGYVPFVGKTIRSEMSKFVEEATEGIDMDAITGAIGGESGTTPDLGAIAGLLGGGSGGLGELLGLLGQFTGKKGKEGSSSGDHFGL